MSTHRDTLGRLLDEVLQFSDQAAHHLRRESVCAVHLAREMRKQGEQHRVPRAM